MAILYQLIWLPVEVAFRFDDDPKLIVDGVAVTLVGASTVVITVFAYRLRFILTIKSINHNFVIVFFIGIFI